MQDIKIPEDTKVAVMHKVKANDDHRAYYDSLVNKIISLARKHKNMRSIEIIGITALIIGEMIVRIAPAEQDAAKKTALQNIENAVAASKKTPPEPEKK